MKLPEDLQGRTLTRRQIMSYFGMAGAGAILAAPAAAWAANDAGRRLIARAASTPAAGSDLEAVEHVVFLMMENRSYDHYFGDYPRGRGFNDHPSNSLGAFAQSYPGASTLVPPDLLLPFHLDSTQGLECTDDLTHDWGPQHLCWDGGKMDAFVSTHTSSTYEGANGAMTMGYYKRADLAFYYALADAFTLCDGYHASILGPTKPNRLMANSGTIDPAGLAGGPVVQTNVTPDSIWDCTWPTMQEVLQDAGVSWKVYSPSNLGVTGQYASLTQYPTWTPSLYNPITNPEIMVASDHVLPYFTAFRDVTSPLYANAFGPTFPNDFVADIASGNLPSVSWMIPPLGFDEHPSSAPANGMYFSSLVLEALTANPEVWSKTALFIMYDENDGWFDHVPPPTAPAGTAGEYLTASPSDVTEPGNSTQTLDIAGPLGLGMRVPCLVVSPFSRGGQIATETFDHTSQLQLIAARFGVEVPNVSAWRSETVGDLTSTLFHTRTNTKVPKLPATAVDMPATGACAAPSQDTETGGAAPSVPTKQRMPVQGGGSQPASKYYPTSSTQDAIDDDERTALFTSPGKETTKSRYNKLAAEPPLARR
jgi:phospholipase C